MKNILHSFTDIFNNLLLHLTGPVHFVLFHTFNFWELRIFWDVVNSGLRKIIDSDLPLLSIELCVFLNKFSHKSWYLVRMCF